MVDLLIPATSDVSCVEGAPSPPDISGLASVGHAAMEGTTLVCGYSNVVSSSAALGSRLSLAVTSWSTEVVLASSCVAFLQLVFSACCSI